MPEPLIAAHKANECPFETVACPFSSVGCNELILRKNIDSHEEASMKQHNRLLLQSLAAQDTSIRTLQQDNSSLWQNIQYNMEAHQSLKEKVSSQ